MSAAASSLRRSLASVAVGQMTSTMNVASNMALVRDLIQNAAAKGAKMLFLPEAFHYIGDGGGGGAEIAEPVKVGDGAPGGACIEQYASLAKKHGIFLSLGGFPERPSDDEEGEDGLVSPAPVVDDSAAPVAPSRPKKRNCNTHIIVSNTGRIMCKYRKLHLFDLDLPTVKLQESSYTKPGDEMFVVETPAGMLGLTTCFDVRFPLLFQALVGAGAEVIAVPSAFTVPTGSAHWEVLMRARAIECQCYVVAAAQVGKHNEKRQTYGHSLVVDPFGMVIGQAGDNVTPAGLIFADIDVDYVRDIRTRMPIQQQARFDVTGKPASDKVTVVKMTEEERALAGC